jgi:hypothetical protein
MRLLGVTSLDQLNTSHVGVRRAGSIGGDLIVLNYC